MSRCSIRVRKSLRSQGSIEALCPTRLGSRRHLLSGAAAQTARPPPPLVRYSLAWCPRFSPAPVLVEVSASDVSPKLIGLVLPCVGIPLTYLGQAIERLTRTSWKLKLVT